jgi:TIR domain
MARKIFVSYSRRDEAAVRDLVTKLKRDGFGIWFDRDEILGGQKWKDVVSQVVEEALAVIICVSSQWVNEKGYVQNELHLIMEASRVQPQNTTWIIPVRLDEDVAMPPQLRDLHYIDLQLSSGYGDLTRALNAVTGAKPHEEPPENVTSPNEFEDWYIDAIERGAVIHIDPWAYASSEEELEFKHMLRGRWEEGMDALEAGDMQRALEIWAPLKGNEFFDIRHPEWRGKPYFLAQILAGKYQTFMALVNLNQRSVGPQGVEALETLEDFVRQPPFSMKGGSAERLPRENARIQNLNYKDALTFALKWFDGWSPAVFHAFYHIPESRIRYVIHTVTMRIKEVEYLLEKFPE